MFAIISFVIFVGEELKEFGFIREKCEKNFESHCCKQFDQKEQRAFTFTKISK